MGLFQAIMDAWFPVENTYNAGADLHPQNGEDERALMRHRAVPYRFEHTRIGKQDVVMEYDRWGNRIR